jgi:hypothetical protein
MIYYGEFHAKTKRGEPKIVITAAGTARALVEQTILRGIKWHCECIGRDPRPLLRQFHEGAWDLHIRRQGVPYCGAFPINQPGAPPHPETPCAS